MSTPRKRNTANLDNDNRKNEKAANGSTTHTQPQKSSQTNSTPSPTAVAATIFSPALVTTILLIFGGCCSTVYTLESILSLSPVSGSLITFLQFLLTAAFTLPSQVTFKNPSSSSSSFLPRLTPRRIPFTKWIIYTILFLIPNFMNNYAFKYRIGVPLHIIVRSAGPVTSMLVGYLIMGRTYPTRKIFAVLILFAGVVMAALSDASAKGKTVALTSSSTTSATMSALSKQFPGFVLLFVAMVTSAFMGIYTDEIYKEHKCDGSVANENLFYSHLLSLPFFAAQYQGLYSQYLVMLSTAAKRPADSFGIQASNLPGLLQPFASYLPAGNLAQNPIVLLIANALTQIVCVTGVNRLATQTSSLTVSVVLNIRKLASLIISIWLFGNRLPLGVTIGAVLVFSGVGLYTYPAKKKKA